MDGRQVSAFIGFAVLFLIVSLTVPAAITGTQTQANSTHYVATGDELAVTTGLNLTANNVTASDVNLTLTGTQSGDATTTVINETNTSSLTTDGTTTNVTVENITTQGAGAGETANLTVQYSRTYNWGDGATQFIGTADVMLGLLAFLVVFGGLWVIMP